MYQINQEKDRKNSPKKEMAKFKRRKIQVAVVEGVVK
jgi:hypothetical protein